MGQAALVQNPVLPGFNPDPNLLYDLATSTFEWWPGAQT
jgi:xylan 1,4-beta-xylosidase